MTPPSPSLLIAGCGFLGEAAADFFCARGWRVTGLTHSPESAARHAGKPCAVRAVDISSPEGLAEFRAAAGPFDFVLHSASSGRGDAAAYRAIYVDGVANLVRTFPESRLVFTGSTSVYAQTDGSWVDETSAAEPTRETSRLLLAAEAETLAKGGDVLRLGGLYGPGRSALLRKFLDGTATLEDGGHRWINQIHRDDAVRAIATVWESGRPGAVWNVVDDEPAPQRRVYGWIAAHFGRPLPPEGPRDPGRKRGWTSKRVSNRRLRSLGWEPQFPSYRGALPSLAGSPGA